MIIDLNGIQKSNSKYYYEQQQLIRLKKIGFAFHDTKMEIILKDFNQQVIPKTIEILARVIYETFYIEELDDPLNLVVS